MADSDWELCCIGNALVDVFARSDEETAERFGITRPVQHIDIKELKGILAALPGFEKVSGGGAANTAKIAGLLGARVCFQGAVSGEESDEFGPFFEKELRAAGAETRLIRKTSPTGICLMLRTGENKTRVAASPSAALELSESDISEEDIQKAKVVVIDGFILDRPDLVRRILRLADEYGTTAAIDLGSEAFARERVLEILDYARLHPLILFMNEREAEEFYGGLHVRGVEVRDLCPPADEEESSPPNFSEERRKRGSSFRRICTFFQAITSGKSFPVIIVKQGPGGAMVFAEGSIYRAKTREVIPVETTGAGDAFCAAFLTAWVRNKPLRECADIGNKAARIILGVPGTQVDRKKLKSIAAMMLPDTTR